MRTVTKHMSTIHTKASLGGQQPLKRVSPGRPQGRCVPAAETATRTFRLACTGLGFRHHSFPGSRASWNRISLPRRCSTGELSDGIHSFHKYFLSWSQCQVPCESLQNGTGGAPALTELTFLITSVDVRRRRRAGCWELT